MRNVLPVSLIVTTLNEATTIESFLHSVASQSILPTEFVICDGGSVDATVEIILRVAQRELKPKVLRRDNASISAGRNHAIENSAMDIIAVTDAGCELYPDWLEKITAPLLLHAAIDIVSGGYELRAKNTFQQIAVASEIPARLIDERSFIPSSRSIAFRKSVWAESGGYPEHLSFAGEDTALCMKWKNSGKKFFFQLDAKVIWYPRNSMRAYVRQHHLYGIGDGESHARNTFYRQTILKSMIALITICVSILFPPAWIAFGIGMIVYYVRLHRIYGWNDFSASTTLRAFVLLLMKELSLFIGWVQGTWRVRSLR